MGTSVPHAAGRNLRGPLTSLLGAQGNPAQEIFVESTADIRSQKTDENVSTITQPDSSSSPFN